MAKNQELLTKIKQILMKKAEGYYYDEESLEYIQKPTKEEEGQIDIETYIESKTNGRRTKRKTKEEGGLVLSKKKITSHYVPPDMLAIKILLENFGEKIEDSNGLEMLSDEELINYKNQLIESLKNISKEDKNEDWWMFKQRQMLHGFLQ